jgi:cytochrome b
MRGRVAETRIKTQGYLPMALCHVAAVALRSRSKKQQLLHVGVLGRRI